LINGSAQITGNLSVSGTETIFNVANLTVNDKDIIVANNVTGGANIDGAGIQAGNPATATWFYNNATTSWQSNIDITPTANGTLSLGGASNYWGNAFLTTVSVTGNVQGGNIRTAGLITATGNITGNFFLGNGSQLTGLQSFVGATGPQGIAGNIGATGPQGIAGNIGATGPQGIAGNIGATGPQGIAGNIGATGAAGAAGAVGATGTFSGTLTSNIAGAGFSISNVAVVAATTLISSTGNITGANVVATNLTGTLLTAAQTNITSVGTLSALSVTGNVQGGNIRTAGLVSATGTVSGSSFTGAGTGLTGTAASLTVGSATTAGTVTTAAQPNITSVGTVTGLNVTASNISMSVTDSFNTITSTKNLRVVSGSRDVAFIANIAGGSYNSLTTSNDSAIIFTGAALGNAAFTISPWAGATSGIRISSVSNVATIRLAATTVQVDGNITNGQTNGVGNIGAAGATFNTIFAKATSAQYADLAEMYVADATYPPGTVVEFGGTYEVTASQRSHSTRVAGIVSTNPSYLMNADQAGEHVVAVALIGRVPCWVTGTIAKGDRLVASDIPGTAQRLDPDRYEPACIIGKALEAYNSDQVGTIEVAVGRT
jgi:hypothetical protein